jgi:hypothetical protein
MKFPENMKVVPVMNYGDMSSTIYSDCINMKNYHHCTFLIQLGTLGTASSVLTITSGASDAAYTTAETFDYAFGGAATASATCDVLAANTSAATLTLTHGTYDDYMLIVEIDASAMTDGQEWLSVVLTDPGSATGNATIFAILEPRYSNVSSATALT